MAKQKRSTESAVLISTPTEQQQLAASLLARRDDEYMPSTRELDGLVDGKLSSEDFLDLAPETHEWFDGFLPALNWWRQLGDRALENDSEGADLEKWFGPNPALEEERSRLKALLPKVLHAFAQAQLETSPYSADWSRCGSKAALELLKAYRLYTREVEKAVSKAWPSIGVELVFGSRN